MSDPKILICWITVLAAATFAYYLGYRAKGPKPFGGIFGTLLAFSFYGILPFIILNFSMAALIEMDILESGGDTDIGTVLIPLIAVPIYWVSAFLGMMNSKKEQ